MDDNPTNVSQGDLAAHSALQADVTGHSDSQAEALGEVREVAGTASHEVGVRGDGEDIQMTGVKEGEDTKVVSLYHIYLRLVLKAWIGCHTGGRAEED